MDYIGLKCPVCGQDFGPGDDIVVCPECGAPYHRECYQKEGRCVYADKHGTKDAWQPPKAPEPPQEDKPGGAENRRCPRCGKPNDKNALFCDHCGLSLSGVDQPGTGPMGYQGFPRPPVAPPQGQNPNVPPQNNMPPYGYPGQTPMPFLFDPLGGINPDEAIEDVKAGEVAKLVQSNSAYYLPVFVNAKRLHRNRFNFSAFLFSGGWLLYRKMYKLGAVITAVMSALYLASLYVSSTAAYDITLRLFGELGVDYKTVQPTMAQYMQFSDLLMKQSVSDILWVLLPYLLGFLQFGIMLFVGFRANRMYCSYCVEKIHKIHEMNPQPAECEVQLQEKGGVNTSLAICLLICFMILFYLPSFLI